MKYSVFIISDAEDDIFEIYRYVATSDSVTKADQLIRKLQKNCMSLSELPNRGHTPPELKRIAIFGYLEIHYKTYRIIYQLIGKRIYIHCILDGRRDLQELLQQRLLR